MARNKSSLNQIIKPLIPRYNKSIYLKQLAVILYTILINVILTILLNKPDKFFVVNAIAPTIDYSHNMRILKLPHSTPVGSLIYRLKGSDADPNTQLVFGVSGIEGRALLDIIPVARTWNEADVYLRAPLEESSIYNLTIYVTDGNKTTQVESTVYVTPDEPSQTTSLFSNQSTMDGDNILHHSSSTTNPFVNSKHIFHVPENAKPDEVIGSVTVLESQKSGLPVRFELRGKGSEKFSIKYVFGPKGQSKGEIILAHQVDYEKQNLYNLKILALNAWTNIRYDTRNVATMDIVITVGDVQDTPPVFKNLPHSLKLSNTNQVGDLVVKVEAEDGDYADQRPINYALDATSPLSAYFNIEKLTGEVKLIKSISELAMHATWDSTSWSMLTIFASEQPDSSSYDHLWPPMYAKVELPIILVDMINEAPKFIGGWQTNESRFNSKILHGYLKETEFRDNPQGNIVRWYTNSSETGDPIIDNLTKSFNGRPLILDLGLGSNGTFELSLEGSDAQLFKIDPSFPITKQTTFTLTVSDENNNINETTFDHDISTSSSSQSNKGIFFSLDIVARDFGSPQRQSSRIKCLIELIDINDNSPEFESNFYSFSIYENAQIGTIVGQVKARDIDSGEAGQIRYTSLNGLDNKLFRLNQDTGQIMLDGHLDREMRSFYLFLVEARDASGTGKSNFTQIMINVLDINDNAPVFLQSHYDAVLLPDGSFYQPLVVKAIDADEVNSANSQVAYEIIAGNQNDLFSIDTVSGVIYSNAAPSTDLGSGSSLGEKIVPPQIPPILKEPITPYKPPPDNINEISGKILPSTPSIGHEVEEATYSSLKKMYSTSSETISSTPISIQYSDNNRIGWSKLVPNADNAPNSLPAFSNTGREVSKNRSPTTNDSDSTNQQTKQKKTGRLSQMPPMDVEQLPALDLLLNLETSNQDQSGSYFPSSLLQARSLPTAATTSAALTSQAVGHAAKVPPVSTLIVRAHDFGIPLRSSSVKVNIYNQALLSRSVSVILNGTAEQLEQRKEAIERAFSSITGSKAVIESIDALSESSSLSVARVKLAVPLHSLVDLTDLSALMNALDYHEYQPHSGGARYPTHYLGSLPNGQPGILSYIPGTFEVPNSATSNATSGKSIFTDIHSYAIDTNNALEKRLLIYIIIVGVCILSLLVIWMIYSCSREGDQIKIVEKPTVNGSYRPRTIDQQVGDNDSLNNNTAQQNKTHVKTAQQTSSHLSNSAIANNLAKTNQQPQEQSNTADQNTNTATGGHLLEPGNAATATSGVQTAPIKADHFSMYNGQVWFESMSPVLANQRSQLNSARSRIIFERRASSAPSVGGNSLDSALHSAIGMHGGAVWPEQRAQQLSGIHPTTPRNASGQFFPNTIGYMENLASLTQSNVDGSNKLIGAGGGQVMVGGQSKSFMNRRQRGRKVAPMVGALSGPGHVAARGGLTSTKRPTGQQALTHKQRGMADMRGDSLEGYTNEAFINENRDNDEDNEENETNSDYEGQKTQDRSHHHHHHHHHHNRSGKPNQHHHHHQHDSRHADGGGGSRRHHSHARHHEHRRQSTGTDERSLASSPSSSGTESQVLLDSDQELLGFDSTGTPIIATHTRTASKSLVIDMLDPATAALHETTPMVVGAATTTTVPQTVKSRKPSPYQSTSKREVVTSSDTKQQVVKAAKEQEDKDGGQKSGVTITKEGASSGSVSPGVAEQTAPSSGVTNQESGSQSVGGTAGAKSNRSTNSESQKSRSEKQSVSSSSQRGSETTTFGSSADTSKSAGKSLANLQQEQQRETTAKDRNEEFLDKDEKSSEARQTDKPVSSRLSSADARRGEVKKTKSQGDLMSELNARLNKRQQSADLVVSPVSSAKTSTEAAAGDSTSKSSPPKKDLTLTKTGSTIDKASSPSSRDQKALKWANSGTNSESSSVAAPDERPGNHLRDMKNSELLEKQSIFALTYSGLTTDKLPE